MQTIIGTLLDVTSRERTWPSGDKSIEHTAHILDGVATAQVTLANPRGMEPGLDPALVKTYNGQRVCLEVYGRGGNNKRVYLTATRVLDVDALADALGLATV
jgi:hypothetical protein